MNIAIINYALGINPLFIIAANKVKLHNPKLLKILLLKNSKIQPIKKEAFDKIFTSLLLRYIITICLQYFKWKLKMS